MQIQTPSVSHIENIFKSSPGSNITPSVSGSTRGTLRWSTERLAVPACAYIAQHKGQDRVAPLGSQAQCPELASQGEHLPWEQTGASELAESPADNEHKSRAGVHLFFAGDVAMPVRCACNVRNSSPAGSRSSSLVVPVVLVSRHLCCSLHQDRQLPLAPKQCCSGHGYSWDNLQEPRERDRKSVV